MPRATFSQLIALVSVSLLGACGARRQHDYLDSSDGDVGTSLHRVAQLMGLNPHNVFDEAVEAKGGAAPASLLSLATKPVTTNLCDGGQRDGLSLVLFPHVEPVPAICQEHENSSPLEKTPELAQKYFKFIGAHDQDPLEVVGNAKFYQLPAFDAQFQEKVGSEILPGVHATFSEVVSTCFANVTNLLRGGAVRDIVVGKRPVDLDLDWDEDTGIIVECMREKFSLHDIEYQMDRQYAKFGKASNDTDLDPLEGFNVQPSGGDCSWENTPNALLYDVTNKVIIDPTGYGIHDVCRSQFRIPPECHSPKQWMNFETTRYRKYAGLRYAKMIAKGFHWADPETDIPFLATALHAQVKTEGPGLHNGKTDLIEKYYDKFEPEDRHLLLAAHRETLFQMMDELCSTAKDVQSVVDRELEVALSEEGHAMKDAAEEAERSAEAEERKRRWRASRPKRPLADRYLNTDSIDVDDYLDVE